MRIQQPALGIARMKRWVRANKLGLEPPIEVLAVLMREEQKGNSGIERAYVDELMSSRFVIGDA
jgi:DNA polymerase delta subunit 4